MVVSSRRKSKFLHDLVLMQVFSHSSSAPGCSWTPRRILAKARNGDVSNQSSAALVVRKVKLNVLAVYPDMLGDHGDDLVLDHVQQLGGDTRSIVNEHQTKALFRHLLAASTPAE
jgi:hypothetical protein